MDIRDMDGLWCDDITFCQEDCDWRDCPRNKCNIRDHRIPHSFSVEIPKDCPKKNQPTAEHWLEADKLPSSTSFLCPHCREKVWFLHGSSSKTRRRGLTKRCLYKICPWCGEEVVPLRVNYISD